MARPEIPSIVVHNGSSSAPGSPCMERSSRTLHSGHSLSKQNSLTGDEECEEAVEEESDALLTSVDPSSPNFSSLPVSPSTPSSPALSSLNNSNPSSPGHNPSVPMPVSSGMSTSPGSMPPGPGPGGGGGGNSSSMAAKGVFGEGGALRSSSLELPHQRSSDSEKDLPLSTSARKVGNRSKLLQRSHAMREDTSPPPDIQDGGAGIPPSHSSPNNSLTVSPGTLSGGMSGRRRLRHQGSLQGSFDGSFPCLSRDSSMEYTDSSGVDLLQFIIQTLHKNQKDRQILFRIEKELITLIKDSKRMQHKFPPMSSYQRMLVHRCAAYFGLEHNVDQVGTSVIVNKTRNTRIPEMRFRDHCRDELLPPDEPKRSILRRDFGSFEDSSYKVRSLESWLNGKQSYSMDGADAHRKGYERYSESRHGSQDDPRWHESRHWGFDQDAHRKSCYDSHRLRAGRLPKVESFESHDSLHPRSLRPPVFKSHSFGGYSGGITVLSRGDSFASNPPSSLRLSKQDSTSSRISDHSSSSGYKTQRQDTSSTNVSNTLSTTPSPTAGPQFLPTTGQPYVNADGTMYRYDPANPPHIAQILSHRSPPILPRDKEVVGKEQDFGDLRDFDGFEKSDEVLFSKEDQKVVSSEEDEGFSQPADGHSAQHVMYPQYIPCSQIESRQLMHETGVNEAVSQMRGLSISTTASMPGPSETTSSVSSPSSVIGPTSVHQAVPVLPRQQFAQTVYYMPASGVTTLPGGGLKYIYPSVPVQGSRSMPPTNMGSTVQPGSSAALHGVGSVPPVPQGMMPTAPAQASMPSEPSATMPGGYVPGSYTVIAYSPMSSTTPTAQESGGTTYYCPIQVPPSMGAAVGQGVPSATTSTMQQYAVTPTTSTAAAYYNPMGYCTPSAVGANGIYPSSGLPGMSAGVYVPSQSHSAAGVGTAAPIFRAPTPPQTPNSQGVGVPMGYLGTSTPGGLNGVAPPTPGIGGQYVAVIPPPQAPNPTSLNAPQMFTTMFRPPVQMIIGSSKLPEVYQHQEQEHH